MSDIEYLKGLDAVRERAHLVLGAAEKNQLLHFDYDASKMGDVADYVAGVISRDFGPDKYDQIPPHGRWQHFDVGGVSRVSSLIQRWESQGWDQLEVTRRLIDLFFVAVLLDAGAGDVWKFQEPGSAGQAYGRSEGIAVAALYMFKAGAFASKVGGDVEVELVDGQALVALDVDTFKRHFQITEENPLVGAASRVELLQRVGSSLMKLPDYFGSQGRPGQLVDYLVRQAGPSKSLDFTMLWKILQESLLPAWPSNRTRIADIPIGDAWPLQVLSNLNGSKDTSTHNNQTHHIAPFHKLTQWLAYSLTVPFMRVLDMQWKNLEKGTGLPEYRNGGLFVDLGVLKLKPQALETGLASSRGNLPSFEATSDVIVEWRAMTVALLDKLHELISARFADQGVTLSMPQMLEAGSWKSGRELAAQYRPESKSSPILIDGDGTLF